MSLKDKLEDWLDNTIGRPARKGIEQVGHVLMAGVPSFLIMNWIPIGDQFQALGAFLLAIVGIPYLWGIAREVTQNWGDEPDEETMFSLGKLPINSDMLMDIAAYSVGGALAGVVAWIA